MDILLTLVIVLVVAGAIWFVYTNRNAELPEETPEEAAKEPAVEAAPASVVKPIYEQPVRSEVVDYYTGPTAPVVESVVAKEAVAPKKERKPRAKKEAKVEVIARAPLPVEPAKKPRRRKAQ